MNIVVNLSSIPMWAYWTIGIVLYAWIGRMISCFYAKRQKAQDLIYKDGGCGKTCCATGVCGKEGHSCRWLGSNAHDAIGDGYRAAKVVSIFAWPVAIALNIVIRLFITTANNGWQKSYDSAYHEQQKQLKAEKVAKATKGQQDYARSLAEAAAANEKSYRDM